MLSIDLEIALEQFKALRAYIKGYRDTIAYMEKEHIGVKHINSARALVLDDVLKQVNERIEFLEQFKA